MKKAILSLFLVLCMLTAAGCVGTNPGASSGAPTPAKPIDLQGLYTRMAEKLPEMLVLDGETMLDYCGIRQEDCVQAVVAICSVNLQSDEIWLLEARDSESLARLRTLVDTRLAVKAAETENYLPEQYEVVKQARVITQDHYLLMLVSGQVEALESIWRDAIG